MQWKYDSMVQEYQLQFNKTLLARIQTTQLKRGGLKVSSMISSLYFSIKTQEKMARQRTQWVAYRKRFANKDDAHKYIARKKEEMLKFILAREKEG